MTSWERPHGSRAMSRIIEESFGRVLDAVRSGEEAPEPGGGLRSSLVNPLATAAMPLCDDAGAPTGVVDHWEQALAWTVDSPDAPGLPPSDGLPGDSVESVARELRLEEGLTMDELRHRRRWFMWNNHPDRRPDIPCEIANRRVAIANGLIDEAMRRLSPASETPA
jgi:hypothetical protein